MTLWVNQAHMLDVSFCAIYALNLFIATTILASTPSTALTLRNCSGELLVAEFEVASAAGSGGLVRLGTDLLSQLCI